MFRTVIAEAAAVTALALAALVPTAAAHAAHAAPAEPTTTVQAVTVHEDVAAQPGTPVQGDNMIWG
ncbi:hypothetical protein [Kitasatospora sp. NPDC058218]|uniref:hypothetical protein n=1 Tax=Kitasatospora sp. NPDC058218 TaxID=3346385 RepID=UPI0036DEB2A2